MGELRQGRRDQSSSPHILLFIAGLAPRAQRQNRREVKNVKSEEQNRETEDLKFIETLGEPQQTSPERLEVVEDKPSEDAATDKSSEVVADIKKDTKNLEDWLDDFLDD